jgi:hypothetical protein
MDESTNTGFLGSVTNWFQHPLNSQGSALNWWLFAGLVIISIWMWNVILLDVTREL